VAAGMFALLLLYVKRKAPQKTPQAAPSEAALDVRPAV
jgi:hypothetical protein